MATAQQAYANPSSQLRRNRPTVLLRMAMDAERQAQVAARIREFRGIRPQRVIAEQANVTLRAYQAWEAGGGINWENVGPLADALGVSEERLLFGRDEPDPSQLDRIEEKIDRLLAATEPFSQLDERLRLVEAQALADEAEGLARSEEGPSAKARPRRRRPR